MPYREKTAWLSLVAMAVTFVPYFAFVASGAFSHDPLPNLRQIGFYAAATFVQVTILLVGHRLLRMKAPDDARIPPDERDLAIKGRSMNLAYYVLMAGTIVVGCIMPFKANGWEIVNAAIFMIVLAETVQYSVVVFAYRRQRG